MKSQLLPTNHNPFLKIIKKLPRGIIITDHLGKIKFANSSAQKTITFKSKILYQNFHDLIHPHNTCNQDNCLIYQTIHKHKPINHKETFFFTKKNPVLPIEITIYPLTEAKNSDLIIEFQDVTNQKKQFQTLNSRINQQRIITKLGIKALSTSNFEQLLNHTVVRISQAMKVDFIKILEIIPNKNKLLYKAGIGWQPDVIANQSLIDTGNNSQAGYTLQINTPVIVTDLPNDTRFNGPKLLQDHNVISGISVIIQGINNQPYGIIGVHNKSQVLYTKDDINFLQSIANILTISLQRNNVENQLHQNQNRLTLALQAGQLAAWHWDLSTDSIIWSHKSANILGFINLQKLPKNIKEFYSIIEPKDIDSFQKKLNTALSANKKFKTNFRINPPTQNTKWLTAEGITTQNNGQVSSLSGVLFDITETQKELRLNKFITRASKILSSSLEYKTTIQSVAKLSTKYFTDWCSIEIINENQIELFAISHKDPFQVKWAKRLRKDNPPTPQTSTALYKTLNTGDSQLISYVSDETYKSHAKTPKELKLLQKLNIRSVIIVPLKVKNQPIGAIEFFSTKDNKMYNHKDLKIAEDLASRVSLAIENSLLYSDAQKAIQTRDDFISIASHELRTPLASMQLYIELLTKRLSPASLQNNKILHPLTKISAQVTKLTNLINDLLNVSRIQLGKLEFNMQDIDLQKIIIDITENMQITTPHSINIYGEVTTPVYADPDRIGQVYTNLLSNAIKYSPKNKPINVFITPLTKSVKITVQDFGIGINNANLPKIFDRFYRGENTTENTYPGLGVGLYISHQIINRHNGKLNAKSKVDQGSSFTFSLPYR